MGIFTEVLRIVGAKAALKASINAKGGTLNTELIDEYAAAVDGISSDATATESDILLGKTAYAGGEKKTGTSTLNADTSSADIVANDLLYDKKGYGAAGTEITGTGAYWDKVTTTSFAFNGAALSGEVSLYVPNVTAVNSMFQSSNALTSIDITFSNKVTNASALCAYPVGAKSLATVTLNGTLINSTNNTNMFNRCTNLVSVIGTAIDLTNSANMNNMFLGCSSLANIAFAVSTIKGSISLADSPLLSTASLLSIANGLDGTAVDKTLTMHATSKTNMLALMVDDVAGVAVDGTTMTLTAFITDVKEWSVA